METGTAHESNMADKFSNEESKREGKKRAHEIESDEESSSDSSLSDSEDENSNSSSEDMDLEDATVRKLSAVCLACSPGCSALWHQLLCLYQLIPFL